MNDLEKLFEHAPEGATEIALFPDGELRYATEGKTWYAPRWIARPHKWQTIATRPQPTFVDELVDKAGGKAKALHKPRKTVEDAVEWAERRWRGGETAICELDGELYFADNNLRMRNVICTREQFEACVDAKAKSEPEWTHLLNSGVRCKFYKSLEWMQGDVYESEDGKFFIPQRMGKAYSIKPIKPTISKDAKAQLELYVKYRIDKYGDYETKKDLLDYLSHHTITD